MSFVELVRYSFLCQNICLIPCEFFWHTDPIILQWVGVNTSQGNRKMVTTLHHEELDCWFSISNNLSLLSRVESLFTGHTYLSDLSGLEVIFSPFAACGTFVKETIGSLTLLLLLTFCPVLF